MQRYRLGVKMKKAMVVALTLLLVVAVIGCAVSARQELIEEVVLAYMIEYPETLMPAAGEN